MVKSSFAAFSAQKRRINFKNSLQFLFISFKAYLNLIMLNSLLLLLFFLLINAIANGNRTEWSPIRSVIIRVITKSDDRAAGVRFVNHEYDYRPNWTTQSLMTN